MEDAFEIEEDGYEDTEIEYEWSKNNSKKNSNNKQFFSFQSATSEVDNSDDYIYDYPVKKNSSAKTSIGTQQSKVVENISNSTFADSDRNVGKKTSETLNSYKDNSNNENALEKAQQMLNKYSNKTFGSVSAKPVVARKFDEDDLSLDSEEDGNEKNVGFNESEESDSFNDTTLSAQKNLKDKGVKFTKAPSSKLGKQKSVSLEVSVFEGEDDDGPDEPITPYAFPSAVKKSLKSEDDEQEDYSEESFDEVDEAIQVKSGISLSNKEDKGKAAIQQQQQENDNTSYSRIDYDGLNESVDEVEEDELEEISTSHRSLSSQAGKPKILTFADLSAQGSWSADDTAGGNNDIAKEESVSRDDSNGSSHDSDEYTEDNFDNSQIQGDPLTNTRKVEPSKTATTLRNLPFSTTATGTTATTITNSAPTVRSDEATATVSKKVSEVKPVEMKPSVPTLSLTAETTKPSLSQLNQESLSLPQQQQQPSQGSNVYTQPPPYAPPQQQQQQPYPYQYHPQEPSAQQPAQPSTTAGTHHYPPYPPYPVYPYGQPVYSPYSPYPPYPPQSNVYPAPGYPAGPYYPPPPPPMPQYYPYPPPPNYNPFYQQYPPYTGYPHTQESQYGSLRASSISGIGGVGGKVGGSNSSLESLFGSGQQQQQQQPIMVDLLQELRKSKEEAEWAKHKLAETIMLASQKDRECQVLEQTLLRKGSALSSAVSSPGKPGRAASPRFPKQGGRSPGRQKPKSFLSGINGSDEDGKEVDDNKEGNENDDDYSSDFEESNASMRGSPRARQRGGQANGAIEKKLSVSVEEDYGPELLAESFPSALGSHPLPSYPSSIPSSAPLLQRPPSTGRPEEERKENSDDVLQAEMALQPLRSSLAKSLLSSQMSTSISSYGPTGVGSIGAGRESPWLRATQAGSVFNEPVSVTGSFKPVPSLVEIKSQFKARKDENVRKLFDVITQVYPNMDKLEAIKLAEMF